MIKVGCCGYAGAREKYFHTFPAVEVQQTFYHPPQTRTLARWRREAPAAFEFTLKAWQLITHDATSPTYRRLRVCLSDEERRGAGSFRLNSVVLRAWDATREAAELLRSNKVLFQCPASFLPSEENKKRMQEFFGRIDRRDFTLIWEPRGRWRQHEVAALCEGLGLVHCVDPFSAMPSTGGLRYYRLHGVGGYRHVYDDRELDDLARKCAGSPEVYVLFNNVSMFSDARRFLALVG